MRKFTQIWVVASPNGINTVYALRDDGTIWTRLHCEGWEWEYFGSAPQDEPAQSPDAIDLEGGL